MHAGDQRDGGLSRIRPDQSPLRLELMWVGLLSAAVTLLFWKLAFTSQFSILLAWEPTNQAYAWYTHAARAVQSGILPAWNPFTFSGHSYIGETQTGLFYPLKLLLYLLPLDDSGMVSARAFHQMFVLGHLLAAVFMFYFVRELVHRETVRGLPGGHLLHGRGLRWAAGMGASIGQRRLAAAGGPVSAAGAARRARR